MVKGLLLKAGKGYETVTLNGELDDYYRVLECDCVDVATRKIAGKYYDIFVDDEGLLNDSPIPSAATPAGEVMLVGNLFVCSSDDAGNTIGISEEDIRSIRGQIVLAVTSSSLDPIPVLIADY